MFLFRCCSHRSDDVDRESTLLSQKEMSKEKARSCGSSAKRLLYHQPGKKMYGLVSSRHADLANANVVTGSDHATNAACESGSYEVGGYCLALLLPETRVETSLMNTAASGSSNDVTRHRKCTCETSASSSAQLLEDDSDAGVIGSDNMAADEEEEVCFSKHSRSSTRWSVPCDMSTNGSSCSASGHDSFRKIYTASGIPGKRISGSHQCESPDTGISWSSPDIASADEMLFPTNPFIITLLSEEFRKLSSGPCHASATYVTVERRTPAQTYLSGTRSETSPENRRDSLFQISVVVRLRNGCRPIFQNSRRVTSQTRRLTWLPKIVLF